jgi:hypothetical protein
MVQEYVLKAAAISAAGISPAPIMKTDFQALPSRNS